MVINERRWHPLLFSASRITCWQGRRLISGALALVYLCAFAALGLFHTHPSNRTTALCCHRASAVARASGPIIQTALTVAPDPLCSLCATAHAAAVALTRPPAALYASVRPPSRAATCTSCGSRAEPPHSSLSRTSTGLGRSFAQPRPIITRTR